MAVQYNTQQKVVYYHTSTTNRSFLEMAQYMKDIGIKNYKWPLLLLDPDLASIDPFDPNLPQAYKVKVLRECVYNPIYFIRECIRIKSANPGGDKFKLSRGNMAFMFLALMNINTFLDFPRQTGKTVGVLAIFLWFYQFGVNNSEINFLNKKLENAVDNLNRIRNMRDLLPSYLKMSEVKDFTNRKTIKEKSNSRDMSHPINKNLIRTVASARTKVAAASLLRGRSTNLIYLDEFAWSPYNQIFYTNMVPAWKTTANNCKIIGAPYGIHITTTPGLLTTDEGKYADDFRKKATEFQESWYDLSKQELDDIIASNPYSNYVYVRYTYQQLGYSEEWFKDMCKDMGNWVDIRREVLLEWSDINEDCPFAKEDLDTIKAMLKQPIATILIFNKYPFKIYERMNSLRVVPILGCDVSAGISRDSSTIVVIDSITSRVTATFECNYIDTFTFSAVIEEVVSKYMPNAVINIERNGGFGTSVIGRLVKSSIKRNLYYEIKDRVVEEQVINGILRKRQQKIKVYGTDSSKNMREELYDLVTDRVNYHKDKVIDAKIHEQLCQLIWTKKGRIDHPENGHDDLVIAWALALYVLYRGGDIANQFGIVRHNIRTDQDSDEEIYEVGQNAELISDKLVDSPADEEVQVEAQLETLAQAPGKYSNEEWRMQEFEREQQAMQKILMTKDGRQAYANAYHVDMTDINNDVMFRMPDEIYTTNYYDELEKPDMGNGAGNLFTRFMRVMGVR